MLRYVMFAAAFMLVISVIASSLCIIQSNCEKNIQKCNELIVKENNRRQIEK